MNFIFSGFSTFGLLLLIPFNVPYQNKYINKFIFVLVMLSDQYVLIQLIIIS
jgi:hypothetical protein